MATGAEAIAAVARVTGIQPITVGGAARSLREAKQDLWPQAERGGGRNSRHVQPHHLVNLAIAVAVANPLTDSPKQTAAFTELIAGPVRLPASGQLTNAIARWKQAVGGPESRIIPGETLGSALAGLIDWISRPSGAEIRVICKGFHCRLQREDGYDNTANISYFEPGSEGNGWSNSGEFYPEGLPLNANVHYTMLNTPGTIQRTSLLRFSLFEVLANLWSDTRNRSATTSPSGSSSPTTEDSGNENAALPQAAPRRPSKRVAAADGPSRPVATLPLLGREKQHAVLGHPQMGGLPVGVTKYDKHASHPSPAEACSPD